MSLLFYFPDIGVWNDTYAGLFSDLWAQVLLITLKC